MQTIALTRAVSSTLAACELTHLERQPIDLALARRQHHAYTRTLVALGCQLVSLPEAPHLPDAVFVEDVAVVLPELAVITRPGAASRRPEAASVAASLAAYRPLEFIQAPGTLEGGDVLRLGRHVYVGISGRSDTDGITQFQAILAPHGYTVTGVVVSGCLHLKSAVTQVGEHLLLGNPAWVNPEVFHRFNWLDVDPSEPYAANALWINGEVLYPASFPATRARLEAQGLRVRTLDVSELQKAEGALTCCSLIFTK